MSPIGVAEGNIGAVEEKDAEQIQMSQDEWTRFYSISRDFQKLIDNKLYCHRKLGPPSKARL